MGPIAAQAIQQLHTQIASQTSLTNTSSIGAPRGAEGGLAGPQGISTHQTKPTMTLTREPQKQNTSTYVGNQEIPLGEISLNTPTMRN